MPEDARVHEVEPADVQGEECQRERETEQTEDSRD
jgi:hypothetical protein